MRPGLVMLLLLLVALIALSCTASGLGVSFTGWAGPTVSGDTIYLASKRGSPRAAILALDALTGTEQGRFTARGEPIAIYGTPLVERNILYTTSVYEMGSNRFGRVWAVAEGNLSVRVWEFPAQGRDAMGPLFGGVAFSRETNTIYVGSDDGKVYAMDATDGSPKRSGSGVFFNAKSPIWSTPVVSDGVVYFGTMGGTLFGIREEGGKVLEFKAGGAIAGTPVVKDGVVYVGSFDKKFYAIGAGGRANWTFSAGNWFWGQPLLAQDPRIGAVIFVGSLDGKVYALDAVSGKLRWFGQTGQGIRAGPVLASKARTGGLFSSLSDQVLVVGSRDGKVYGFDPITGNPAWPAFDAGGRVLSPPIAEGNVVYFVNMDYELFAIDASVGGRLPGWIAGGQGQ
ncbi:MAG: PQQ-binding-like beta-propeller repeat protein [Dehalococcoidia bacterium]